MSSCWGASATGHHLFLLLLWWAWLQIHTVLHSPGSPCQHPQLQLIHAGQQQLALYWWRTNHWGLLLALDPCWNPIGFPYLVFCCSLLEQRQKTSCLRVLSSSCQQSTNSALTWWGDYLGEDMENRPRNFQNEKHSNTALQLMWTET